MSNNLSIEELVIDDSFSNYCLQSNREDVLFWRAYINAHPEQRATIEEAREMVLGLRLALYELYKDSEKENELRPNERIAAPKSTGLKRMLSLAAAVAAVFLIIIGGKMFMKWNAATAGRGRQMEARHSARPVSYTAAPGEKKTFHLPDSTTIHLNAGSTLRLEEGFGSTNRVVYLSGEALFDVTHRLEQPFIVRLADYDVRVLGTLFNVRSYPGEKISETSLIRGKVQIIKSDGGDLTLVPSQKVIFKQIQSSRNVAASNRGREQVLSTQKIVPISINPKDGSIVETAWAQNRLEVVNESFSSLKAKLERWYNIQIVLTDKEVSEYRFTATFEKESIKEVLEALQFAYPFTYELKDGKVIISK